MTRTQGCSSRSGFQFKKVYWTLGAFLGLLCSVSLLSGRLISHSLEPSAEFNFHSWSWVTNIQLGFEKSEKIQPSNKPQTQGQIFSTQFARIPLEKDFSELAVSSEQRKLIQMNPILSLHLLAASASASLSTQDLDTKLERVRIVAENRQEWNQRVPEQFRNIVAQIPDQFGSQDASPSLEKLQEVVEALHYSTLSMHLSSLLPASSQGGIPVPSQGLAQAAQNSPIFVAGVSQGDLQRSRESDLRGSESLQNPAVSQQIIVQQPHPQAPPVESAPTPVSSSVIARYFEAFESGFIAVSDVVVQFISKEHLELSNQDRGWALAFNSDHWPTLHWVDPSMPQTDGVPLIEGRKVQNLLIAGIHQESAAGIVFGKVLENWTVSFGPEDFLSGQTGTLQNEPLYFELQGSRYFAFINVNPGSRVISMQSQNGEGGGIALPVRAGTATYLDLSQISRQTLSGRFLSLSDQTPLAGVSLRVLGQNAAVAVSHEDGRFRVKNVFTAGNYPVFIDSNSLLPTQYDPQTGIPEAEKIVPHYIQRYRALPERMMQLIFSRIDDSEVEYLVDRYREKVSPESGFVMAILPQIVAAHSSLNLSPSVQSLVGVSALTPSVRTLLFGGGTLKGAPLQQNVADEFIAVNVSEGPAVAQVNDPRGDLVWGELIFISPGVVNIIGPH